MRAAVFAISFSIAILAALPARLAAMQNISLDWDASPSPGVAGYNVHYGLESGVYTETVPAGTNTSATVSGLVEGMTYYFVVNCFDAAGNESAFSNEADYSVPGLAPPANPLVQADPATGAAILKWNPSPSPEVAGYNVYCGTDSGDDPKLIFTGETTRFVLPDLAAGTTCYFVVTAYDFTGEESPATMNIFFTAPLTTDSAGVGFAPVLSLRQSPAAGLSGVFSITASGAIPLTWALEASTDLRAWGTLTTGSQSAVNVTVVVSPKPRLFFRLDSSLPDVQMQTRQLPDAFPNSFCVSSTAETSPPAWTIQTSEDLQVWNPLTSGTGTSVNMAVVTADVPALFFRLKSL